MFVLFYFFTDSWMFVWELIGYTDWTLCVDRTASRPTESESNANHNTR